MSIRWIVRHLITRLRPRYEYMRDNPAYSRFEIGRFTYGRPLVMWGHEAKLKIGSFCSIGDGTNILLGGNHRTEWVTTYPFPARSDFKEFQGRTDFSWSKGDVLIGNDVWIGQDVIILSGLTIGDGAVVGAGSVVAKSVPPYSIAVGNPARVIRTRFPAEQVRALLHIEWWNWPLERIKANMPRLLKADIGGFIAAAFELGAGDRSSER